MSQHRSSWTYRRLTHAAGVETSEWHGTSSPSLSAHFHEETQISLVSAGQRLFQIGQKSLQISAGQFAVIPAGIPHRSQGLGGVPTKSRDIFISPAHLPEAHCADLVVGTVRGACPRDEDTLIDEMLDTIRLNRTSGQRQALANSLPEEVLRLVQDTRLPIKQIAARLSLSREGFIRRFAREIGMTPHAYRLARRATQARALLRACLPPAAAAYECGFADQSHLGRVFRKNFGTTPATYRKAWQR